MSHFCRPGPHVRPCGPVHDEHGCHREGCCACGCGPHEEAHYLRPPCDPDEEASIDRLVAECMPNEVLCLMESDCVREKMYNYTRLVWRSAIEHQKRHGGHCGPCRTEES